MPQEWVDPETLIEEHLGVTVYHCYTDQQMVSACWYTVDPANSDTDNDDGSGTQFDVGDIYDATDLEFADDETAIRYAIEAGWLTDEGLNIPQEGQDAGQN